MEDLERGTEDGIEDREVHMAGTGEGKGRMGVMNIIDYDNLFLVKEARVRRIPPKSPSGDSGAHAQHHQTLVSESQNAGVDLQPLSDCRQGMEEGR